MSIDRFYNTTFAVKRMEWSGESADEANIDSFVGHIQQAGAEYMQHIGEAWGKSFLVWCAKETDVQPGDTINIASGDFSGTYSVKNKQINFVGNNQHCELTLIKDEN